MDYFVIGFLVASVTLCFIAIYFYRRSRRLEKENHERLMRELDENNARIRQARAERREKMTSLYTPVSTTKVVETRAHQDRYSDRRPVAVDDNSDMLTMMILQNAMNSSSDTTSGSVRWDNDTPTITPTPSSSYESSSSSSYSSYSSSDSSSSYSSSDSGSSSSFSD